MAKNFISFDGRFTAVPKKIINSKEFNFCLSKKSARMADHSPSSGYFKVNLKDLLSFLHITLKEKKILYPGMTTLE